MTRRFEIAFEGRGRASGKMRNDIAVDWPARDEHFDLATDEGDFHGGDGTAPPPLALFTAALIGCIMTQLRAFAPRLGVQVDALDVHADLRWQGEQEGRAPYVGSPVGFRLDIDLASPATLEQRIALVQAACMGCFIERSLAPGVILGHRLRDGETWVDVPPAPAAPAS